VTLTRLAPGLLIVVELGYLSFSRCGAEPLFQVFADRYDRRARAAVTGGRQMDGFINLLSDLAVDSGG